MCVCKAVKHASCVCSAPVAGYHEATGLLASEGGCLASGPARPGGSPGRASSPRCVDVRPPREMRVR